MFKTHEEAFEEFCKQRGIEGEAKEFCRETFWLGVEKGYDECWNDLNIDFKRR